MKRLLIFCSNWMYEFEELSEWQVFSNIQESYHGGDARFTKHSEKFGESYTKAVKLLKPDVVLSICVGCTEPQFDAWDKPEGPVYITWSTDSYNHTKPCKNSDIHLSSIPDTKCDNFVPLFFEWYQRPRLMRKYKVGMCARPHKVGNRQMVIENLKHLPIRINQDDIPVADYMNEIRSYYYGLNIPVHTNALPNFRNFELGSCGVMPLCPRQDFDLEEFFEGNIKLYDELTPEILDSLEEFDPFELQTYYNRYHNLHTRIEYIFHTFLSESFQ